MVISHRVEFWKSENVWMAQVPAISGCITHGETLQEAQEMIEDAYCMNLQSYADDGLPVPNSDLDGFGLFYSFDFTDRGF